MKKPFSYLLIVLSSICYGQVHNLSADGKILSSCKRPIENKEIGLCNSKEDTLTFIQLKNCKELTLHNSKKQIITSYRLSYYLNDSSSIKEIKKFDNKLSDEIISGIITDAPKKIFIEDIVGTEGDEKTAYLDIVVFILNKKHTIPKICNFAFIFFLKTYV